MTRIEQIAYSLLLNAGFIDNIGLLNGKMGIFIAFYHLYRKTGNKIYEDFAGELIDEISEEILVKIRVSFGNGLAGIDWISERTHRNFFYPYIFRKMTK